MKLSANPTYEILYHHLFFAILGSKVPSTIYPYAIYRGSLIVGRSQFMGHAKWRDKIMADLKKIGGLLILLGGILGLIEGVLTILGTPIFALPSIDFALGGLITGIIGILFSLIALANSGFIKIPALEFSNKWMVILIVGILMYLFASGLGGVLVIIGAILLVLK